MDKRKHGKINAKYNIQARDYVQIYVYTSTLYCYAKQPLREWEPAKTLDSYHQCCGSGSVSQQRYGSRSGSFYHQAKIVRKILIFTVLSLLYDFLSFKNDVHVPSKITQKK